MTKELLRTIQEKMEALGDLKYRFESLISRLEENRRKKMIVSLPEFEAYGWEHLGEFSNRLEDAVNHPLLEEARRILDDIEIPLQTFDKLKSALSVRREGLITTLKEMNKELKKIQSERLQNKAREDITRYIDEGRWDELVAKLSNWRKLEVNLGSLMKVMSNDTYLYNAVFEKALEEGPSTGMIDKLKGVEDKASHIGGGTLRDHVKFEEVQSQVNPLASLEDNLEQIAKKKEELRQLTDEEADMNRLIERNKTLSTTIDKLNDEYKRVKELFETQYRTTEKLLQTHNNLATILKSSTKTMPPEISLKRLKEFDHELKGEIKKLESELEKTLTTDARRFVENIIEGKLPEGWDEKRIVDTLKELLDKKFSLEVKLRA